MSGGMGNELFNEFLKHEREVVATNAPWLRGSASANNGELSDRFNVLWGAKDEDDLHAYFPYLEAGPTIADASRGHAYVLEHLFGFVDVPIIIGNPEPGRELLWSEDSLRMNTDPLHDLSIKDPVFVRSVLNRRIQEFPYGVRLDDDEFLNGDISLYGCATEAFTGVYGWSRFFSDEECLSMDGGIMYLQAISSVVVTSALLPSGVAPDLPLSPYDLIRAGPEEFSTQAASMFNDEFAAEEAVNDLELVTNGLLNEISAGRRGRALAEFVLAHSIADLPRADEAVLNPYDY